MGVVHWVALVEHDKDREPLLHIRVVGVQQWERLDVQLLLLEETRAAVVQLNHQHGAGDCHRRDTPRPLSGLASPIQTLLF